MTVAKAAQLLIPVTLYYSVSNGGDGSAYPIFFLTQEKADEHQESMSEGWGEPCTGSIESFVGSETYKEAQENEVDRELFGEYDDEEEEEEEEDDEGEDEEEY